eukprot:CAMPEP_0197690902 /NCGR_PEP_ID=MMETSP1338-20131121/108997_1 /TAXON_ID=43686 ORGANISM="Pelagodinium beii, Strain RCC1491" /NCGR_SAMPLE_ID=MMETSP1338 /ASSEMBLY_ACC=CAM_ASM_000754 /LENGTH=299 /DNA_ID=CAMNT_0043273401 /DNA_START=9 /DNA_END=905 /DNA_ORIENTATION=-
MRAVRIANESGPEAGLAALGEVSQDYPSGWGRELAAGTADEEKTARKIMVEAKEIGHDDSLEVNGWRVPENQRGVHQLLRSQVPLFRAVELLASAGFDQQAMFSLIQNSRSGDSPPTRIDTGDPRLAANSGSSHAPPVFHFASARKQLVGVGLVLDPCSRKHLKFFKNLLDKDAQAVVWLHLRSEKKPEMAAFIQSGIKELLRGSPGEEAARQVLRRFYEKKADEDEDLCDSEAEKRFMGPFKKAWKNAGEEAPKLKKPSQEGFESSTVALPVPSACVNGKMITENIFGELMGEIDEES